MSPQFARLLPYLLRYQRAFLLGLSCVVTTTAIQLLSPWVLKNAIDDLNAGVTRGKLTLYAGLLLAIAVVGGIFRFLMRRILIGASRDIEYDLRNAFFARLQLMPLAYYQARRTGDLMSRATNDLNAVRTMIGPAVMYSANTMIVFVVAIILMASIDGRLTLIALLPLPLVSISVKYFGSAIHARFEAIQAQLADLSAVVQESLSGVRVVRAYNQEPHELARFRAANDEYVRRNRVLIRLQGMFYPSMTLFLGFGSLLVLWVGSREAISGRISVGEFVAFNAYLVMLSWPMIAFGWVTNILQRGMASWKRMLEVLDAQPDIDDGAVSPAGRAVVIRGAIEVRDLTFTYPTSQAPALERVSLRIGAGETAAFIGATGCGKSTLINLLPRLHEPPPGTVFLDGVDVREIPIATLRAAVGFVPQEPFLFSDTIAENIAFGVEPDPRTTQTGHEPRTTGTTQTADEPRTTRTTRTGDEPRTTGTTQTADEPRTTRTTQTGDEPRTTRTTRTGDEPRTTRTTQTGDGPRTTRTTQTGDEPRTTRTTRTGDEPRTTRTTQTGDGPRTTRTTQTTDGPRTTRTTRTGDEPRTTRTTQTGDEPRTTQTTQTTDEPRTTRTGDGSPVGSLEERIRAAAAIARLDKDVETFPKGYDTLVGERGITLSGGQKQRTAIARALMVDPRLLILDDALSAVDTFTEEEILTRLRGVMRQRTSLIVSHRVSTVRDADRIFVLDRGRVVEEGRHDELVSRGGLYATLHRRQLLEEEVAAS